MSIVKLNMVFICNTLLVRMNKAGVFFIKFVLYNKTAFVINLIVLAAPKDFTE